MLARMAAVAATSLLAGALAVTGTSDLPDTSGLPVPALTATGALLMLVGSAAMVLARRRGSTSPD